MSGLIDRFGQPLKKALLTREVAGPTLAGVRQPVTGYPGDGLTPIRLARILREADDGDPLAYFELAEQIEERDLHYAGVLGTRKRSVSQVEVTVEAASDAAEDVRRADMVREWIDRDELADETFDILDAIGKGVSWTEIVWDTSEGQWRPAMLEWRDPRWFRFDRDGREPLLRGGLSTGSGDGNGQDAPLPAFKFIRFQVKAKSGLAVRSGIARLATWAWLFKAYTQRDWAIFTQTYGQPVRLGKYHAGATEEEKQTLFRAVANIAGDCAAIVPEAMQIDFVSADNLTAADLYEKRSDWLDRQVSKAVLGQTNTTDAQAGGLGSGQALVHNDVREDIETADCKSLSAALNRDVVRPWMDLEFGPEAMRAAGYPRLVIARPQQEDLKLLSDSLAQLVPLGFRVGQSEVRDKFGFSEPADDEEVLEARKAIVRPEPARGHDSDEDEDAALRQAQGDREVVPDEAMQQQQGASGRAKAHPADLIARRMAELGAPAVEEMAATIETMLDRAADLGEFRAMLAEAYGDVDSAKLAQALAGGLASARAAGRSDLADESA